MQLELGLDYTQAPKRDLDSIVPASCSLCSRYKLRTNILRGEGPKNADIVIVLENPDEYADALGAVAIGNRDGILLNRILRRCSLQRRSVFITYLVKCGITEPKTEALRRCSVLTLEQIKAIEPKLVICFGKTNLKTLTGDKSLNISLAHGAHFYRQDLPKTIFLPVNGFKAIFADPNVETKIVNDISRGLNKIRAGNKPPIPRTYLKIDTIDKLLELEKLLASQDLISLDIETNGQKLFFNCDVACWAISWAPGKAAFFPWTSYDRVFDIVKSFWNPLDRIKAINVWKRILARMKVVLHSGKYDLKIMRHRFGINVGEFFWDTKISSTLIDETQDPYLKPLAWVYTDIGGYERELEDYKKTTGVKFDYSRVPEDIMMPYNCGDADVTLRIYLKQKEQIAKLNMNLLMKDLNMPLSQKFMEVEYEGVLVDRPYLEKLKIRYEALLKEKADKICAIAGKRFNVESNAQLGHILFTRLGLPPIKFGTSGASADKDSLKKLKGKHAIIEPLLEYRDMSMRYKTFIRGILKRLDVNNRVHTEYKIGETDTGRTACVDAATELETNYGTIKIGDLDLAKCPGITIKSHTGADQRITKKIYKGQAPMYRVELQDGQYIICTKDHKFLTSEGWRRLNDITCGERVYSYSHQSEQNNLIGRSQLQKVDIRRKPDAGSDISKVRDIPWDNLEIPSVLQTEICERTLGGPPSQVCKSNVVTQKVLDSTECTGAKRALSRIAKHGKECVGDIANTKNQRILSASQHGFPWYSLSKRCSSSSPFAKVGYRIFGKIGNTGSRLVGERQKLLQGSRGLFPEIICSIPSFDANGFFHKERRSSAVGLLGVWKNREVQDMLEFKQRGNPSGPSARRLSHSSYTSILLLREISGGFLLSSKAPHRGNRRGHAQVHQKRGQGKRGYHSTKEVSTIAIFPKRSGNQTRLCSELYQAEVIRIIPVGVRDVWDITVENDHSYLSQGFVNHNSANPNLQNLEAKNKDIKRAFIARPGFVLYELDFSQMEIRVLAHMSGDESLIAALRSKVDIHRAMASKVFRVPVEKVTDEMRKKSKSVTFGIIYGMSYKTLAEKQGMPEWEAKEVYDNFLNAFPRAKSWMADVRNFALLHKKVYSMLGRVRHLDSIDHPISKLRTHAERCAVNTPIQSTGADIPNLGILAAGMLYPETEWGYRLFMQVHDAGYYEVPLDKEHILIPRIKECLETTTPLVVPTPVGIKRGFNLGQMQEIRIWKSSKTGREWCIPERN